MTCPSTGSDPRAQCDHPSVELASPDDMQLRGSYRRWAYVCSECGAASDRSVPVNERRVP